MLASLSRAPVVQGASSGRSSTQSRRGVLPPAASAAHATGQSDRAPMAGRRMHLLSAAAAAALAAAGAPPQAAAVEPANLTPFQRGQRLEYGLTSEGRIMSCPSDANPNWWAGGRGTSAPVARPSSRHMLPVSRHLPSYLPCKNPASPLPPPTPPMRPPGRRRRAACRTRWRSWRQR